MPPYRHLVHRSRPILSALAMSPGRVGQRASARDAPTDLHRASGKALPKPIVIGAYVRLLNKSLQRLLWADETADADCPGTSTRMRACCSQCHRSQVSRSVVGFGSAMARVGGVHASGGSRRRVEPHEENLTARVIPRAVGLLVRARAKRVRWPAKIGAFLPTLSGQSAHTRSHIARRSRHPASRPHWWLPTEPGP
jgi:hypothetical protein